MPAATTSGAPDTTAGNLADALRALLFQPIRNLRVASLQLASVGVGQVFRSGPVIGRPFTILAATILADGAESGHFVRLGWAPTTVSSVATRNLGVNLVANFGATNNSAIGDAIPLNQAAIPIAPLNVFVSDPNARLFLECESTGAPGIIVSANFIIDLNPEVE